MQRTWLEVVEYFLAAVLALKIISFSDSLVFSSSVISPLFDLEPDVELEHVSLAVLSYGEYRTDLGC